jgi:hypothetical protein
MSGPTMLPTPYSIGQAAEWLLWTHLTLHSPLHVFIPLWDLGIDGVVRLPGTDMNQSVQVKSRSALQDGMLHIPVRDHELRDERAVIVMLLLHAETSQLDPMAICVDVPTFRRLGFRREGANAGYEAGIPFPSTPKSRWHPYVVRLEELAARLIPQALASGPSLETAPHHAEFPPSGVGRRAEARLIQLLCGDDRLNVFKAFPDIEMVEYLARHVHTGAIAGFQVKAISVDDNHKRGAVAVPRPSYAPSSTSWFTVFAERRDTQEPYPTCLLIPSADVAGLLHRTTPDIMFTWDPDNPYRDTAVTPYICPTNELAARIAGLLEG